MKLLVTGAKGFIGRNLCLALRRTEKVEVLEIGSDHTESDLTQAVAIADAVVHLAGVNRPEKEEEFIEGNVDFTQKLCDLLAATGRKVPVVCSSSTQAERDNAYGTSKRGGEQVLLDYQEETGSPVYVFRLPNVFGKWSRPDYNTVVATFCHNISRGLPVTVNDSDVELTFAYVDDVVSQFVACATGKVESGNQKVETGVLKFDPAYKISLGELHDLIVSFK